MRAPVAFCWRPLSLSQRKRKGATHEKERGDKNRAGSRCRDPDGQCSCAGRLSGVACGCVDSLSVSSLVGLSQPPRSPTDGAFSAIRRALPSLARAHFLFFLPLFPLPLFFLCFLVYFFFFYKKNKGVRVRAARHGAFSARRPRQCRAHRHRPCDRKGQRGEHVCRL